MKHSNRYFIKNRDGFEEVTGHRVKNDFELDLFWHTKHGQKKLTEGITGCALTSSDEEYPADINEFLTGINRWRNNMSRVEIIKKTIEQLMEKGDISPRYTEPKNNKPKVKKEKSEFTLARCLYEKGKKYFALLSAEPNIYRLKSSLEDSSFYMYIPCVNPETNELWMIPQGTTWKDDNSRIDNLKSQLENGFNIDSYMRTLFESQMSVVDKWVDLGVADYLNKRDEAESHNKVIRAARDAERQAEQEKRQAEQAEAERAAEAAEAALQMEIATAEENVRQNKRINAEQFMELCKKYNVEIPIKVKGWINKSLVSIDSNNYSYSGNKSTTIFGYYEKLKEQIV